MEMTKVKCIVFLTGRLLSYEAAVRSRLCESIDMAPKTAFCTSFPKLKDKELRTPTAARYARLRDGMLFFPPNKNKLRATL
jgi:hypothetical protein